MKKTKVKDWYIVEIIDLETDILVGEVLWAIVICDDLKRFLPDDYVCTSKIKKHDFKTKLVTTFSGNIYELINQGRKITINFQDFIHIKAGISPVSVDFIQCHNLYATQ